MNDDPNRLVGYCEHCDHWTHFEKINRSQGCEKCGNQFSSRHGYQITTERTFNPSASRKKITKAESAG